MGSSMSAAPRLAVRGLSRRFGATQALERVELELAPGEIHALVGENGAGKSTLMNLLAGALAPDEGRMELDGAPYAPRSPLEARASGLAMIHQELALAPHLTVAENVLLGREPRFGPFVARRELRARARAALALVQAEDLDLDLPLGHLAPAERQKVEIARALALEARVVVLDEPTSSLSRADALGLFAHLRGLAARGTTIVYVSHALEEVFELCTRYTVLRDGRAVACGALSELDPGRLVAAMVGRNVATLYPRTRAVPGEVVLRVEDLAGRRLPRKAALELRRGEVLGLAGLIGAGRTELLRAIFGLDPVRSGALRVGALSGPRSPAERWASGTGFLSEDRKGEGLALSRSVAENACLPILARAAGPFGLLGPATVARWAEPWLSALGVRCTGPHQAAGALSGGNQQKVALARLFAAEAEVWLLDEPTRGVDVGAKAELYRWIDELAHRRGRAVLLVSSYLPELLGVADRIAVMGRGELGPARPAEELSEHELAVEMTARRSA
jgi:ribose transport system ATP-binding protein